MIYGAVIDSTCLVLQQSCTRKGACLLYDHDILRFRLHILPLCTQVATAVLKALAWYLSRRQEKAAPAVDVNAPTSHPDAIKADGDVVAASGPGREDGVIGTEKETII